MAKNLILGLILAHFAPNSFPKLFSVGCTSTRFWTLLQPIIVSNFKENEWTKLEKIAKNLVLGRILVHLAKILHADFTTTKG